VQAWTKAKTKRSAAARTGAPFSAWAPPLYTLALGNSQWRGNNNDMIYHLNFREAIEDSIFEYLNPIVQQRRISSIPLYQPLVPSCSNSSCYWEVNQPFVLHTADDYPIANLGTGLSPNYQPGHAIAFRTVDISDPNNNTNPFYGSNRFGGGKLGAYQYWNTCGQNSAPVLSTNNSNTQFEFYNYSPHPPAGNLSPNLQELGNQYFNNSGGGVTPQAQLYYNDFFNSGSPTGINVQNELYFPNTGSSNNMGNSPARQVQHAVQIAYQNYLKYLRCKSEITGPDGTTGSDSSCSSGNTCGPFLF
jgi:hypothetical protein